MSLHAFFHLLRVRHYVKNLFVFLPLFFGLGITNIILVEQTIIAFFSFCLVASSVYIMNDLIDIENDRLHDRKKHRPLAANLISKKTAITTFAILLFSSLSLALSLSLYITLLIAIYFIINIAYSSVLKKIPILDVSIIASGFVIRLLVGSAASGVPLSMWIVLMVFLLSLFLGFAERREDVSIFLRDGSKMRTVVDGYNLEFLNAAMVIMASVVTVSYILYTVSSEVVARTNGDYLYLTTIFVLLGILRYLQLSFVHNDHSSPVDILLRDRFLQMTIAAWVVMYWVILYV